MITGSILVSRVKIALLLRSRFLKAAFRGPLQRGPPDSLTAPQGSAASVSCLWSTECCGSSLRFSGYCCNPAPPLLGT